MILRLSVAVALVANGLSVAAPPLERFLPADCAVVLAVRDVPGVMQRMQASSFFKASEDAAMKPFMDDLKKQWKALLAGAGSNYGVDFEKASGYLRGSTVFAFRFDAENKDSKEPTDYYMLSEVGDSEKEVAALFEGWINKAVRDGQISKRTVGEVTVLTPSKGADPEKNRFCFGMKGGVFVATPKPETTAKVLRDVPGGNANSLFDNPKLQRLRRTMARQAKGLGDVEALYLDMDKLADQGRADGMPNPNSANLKELDAFGASLNLGKGEFELLAQFVVSIKPNSELLKNVTTPNRPLPTDAWAPANASAYVSFNFDVDRVYQQIAKQIETLSPGGMEKIEEQLREFPDKANPLITSIKRDIVDPLGERITFLMDSTGSKPDYRTLLGWKLRDAARVSRLVEGLVPQAGPLLTKKEVKGVAVFMAPPGVGGGPRSPINVGTAAFAVSKTHLFATTHVELLDRVLSYEGQPGLAEAPAAQRVAAKVPAEPAGVAYLAAPDVGRWLFEAVKNDMVRKAMAESIEANENMKRWAPGLSEAVKSAKLPAYDTVKKYFTASAGGYMVIEDNMMRFTAYLVR